MTSMTSDSIISSFSGEYAFLSNFYIHEVRFEGITYPTNEHAFQAAKTLNEYVRTAISQASTPTEAKYLGRSVELRPHWDSYYRYNVMRRLLKQKFSNSTLNRKLRMTTPAILIEGNTWGDKTWGAVESADGSWEGHNLLGWMLMEERSR